MSWTPVADAQLPNWTNINDSQINNWSTIYIDRLLQESGSFILQQNGYYIGTESDTPALEDWQNIVT